MFSSDEERIIPKKRVSVAGILTQVILAVFLLSYFALLFFENALQEITQFSLTYLLPIFLIVLIGIPLASTIYGLWIQRSKWQALAEELGFQVHQPKRWSLATLQGTYRGHRFSISQTSESRGRSRVYFTNYVVTLNASSKASFEIQKRSFTHFNRNRIGDEAFDKKFSTRTSSQELIGQILRTSRLRLGIMQLDERARTRNLTLKSDTLSYVESGKTSDTEYMRAVIGLLAELAHAIERMEQMDAFR